MQTTNITVVIIVFSTSHACDIAQSRDSNTVQRYSPHSNSVSLCVSSFHFRRVRAADLALAGRTQFLFSRRDLLQEMTS